MKTMVHSIMLYVAVIAIVFILVWGWWSNGYFKRRGIKSPPGYLPVVGQVLQAALQRENFNSLVVRLYQKYPDERYVGLNLFGTPMLVLRDIELIKQVGIRDFENFIDHRVASFDKDADLVFGNGLFSLRGEKWREMRFALSPAYTRSKMKQMFQFIVKCGQQMAEYYTEQIKMAENKEKGLVEVEMKDVFARYANDVVATCIFGVELDSFTDKTNQFYSIGREASNFSGWRLFRCILHYAMPPFAKLFNIRIFTDDMLDFYRNLIGEALRDREERNIIRRDLIHFLMELKKGNSTEDLKDENTIEWTDNDIVAQTMFFFLGGFDTSSTVLSFLAYELAINPDIQKRLQDEIDEAVASTDGNLTYNCLQRMKYMDMVVSESLRKWPPFAVYDRKCLKPYLFPPPNKNGRNFEMESESGVFIPTYAIHHDPQYFEDPEKFDPERFSDENKHKIKPYTYLPFGIGLRNCIGLRFALMEVKIAVFYLLYKFDIVPTERTTIPLRTRTNTFTVQSEGYWLGLKLRSL